MRFNEIFYLITGKKATPEDINKLETAAKLLKSKDNDTVMILLSIFEGYYGTLKKTPQDIVDKIEAETLKFKDELEISKKDLFQTVDDTIKVNSKKATANFVLKWITTSVVLTAIIFGGAILYLHDKVYDDAFKSAYNQSMIDFKAQDEWSKTENAQKAFKLDQAGYLDIIVNCSGKDWFIEEREAGKACLPRGSGWYMK